MTAPSASTSIRPDSNRTSLEKVQRGMLQASHDIDTVSLRLEEPVEPDVLRRLDSYEEQHGDVAWLRSTARLRNLRISTTESITRIRGSLAVFIAGTNAVPFDYARVSPALDELAGALQVPPNVLLQARVMRLDIGVNVPLSHPVSEVTAAILPPPRMRIEQRGPASAAAKTETREVYFYDKRAERGRRPISRVYGDGPLLRVELRYLRQVDRQFARSVTARHLLSRDFYNELGRRLITAVEKVPIRRVVRYDRGASVRELRDSYALHGIESHGGLEIALQAIRVGQDAGLLDRNQAYAQRRWLRSLTADPSLTAPLDLTRELHLAVRRAVNGQLNT